MELKQRIDAFVQLGKVLGQCAGSKEWSGYTHGVSQSDFDSFSQLLNQVYLQNGWFTEENVRKACLEWSRALSKENLEQWTSAYSDLNGNEKLKTIALIMAGNIPMVGFHDLVCVLISGNKALIKMSSEDDRLVPWILTYLVVHIEPEFASRIKFASGKLEDFSAVIATGSDNTMRYFEKYFGTYPHIFRGNRTSVAVLDGSETEEELNALGHDIFDYFGLGCRNVSKLFIPKDFDLDRFFGAIYSFHPIVQHKKYANNYDYNKAIMMMNQDDLIENGFLLVKEDKRLHSPLGALYVERYTDLNKVTEKLKSDENEIQCVVSKSNIPFGKSQSPELWDYADHVDTLKFLLNC